MLWPLLASPPAPATAAPEAAAVLPWQVQTGPRGGSRVFGLEVGVDTLADVQARFPDDLAAGLIVPHGQAPALEAYVESFKTGFVTGKLVLAFEADAGWLQRAQARSPRNEVGEGGRSRRYSLAEDDGPTARSARLVALAFLPSARLDESVVVQRFGQPAERHVGPGGELQLLYPAMGVAVALPPAEGELARAKSVIQYVAPADFEARLRAPLQAARAASAGG